MDMDMTLNVLPNIEMQLVIDPTVGDVIKGKGSGQLTMRIVPKSNIFEMRGDVQISEGTYHYLHQRRQRMRWSRRYIQSHFLQEKHQPQL